MSPKNSRVNTFNLFCLILCSNASFSQVIGGVALDSEQKNVLTSIMVMAGVESVQVTSITRTMEHQIEVMYEFAQKNYNSQLKRIAPNPYDTEGKAILSRYEEGRAMGQSAADIRAHMLTELKVQWDSIKQHFRLMHIDQVARGFVVFDVGIKSVKPSEALDKFEEVALSFKGKDGVWRVLVRANGEPDAIHFEFKK
jgi:hypothetical protein